MNDERERPVPLFDRARAARKRRAREGAGFAATRRARRFFPPSPLFRARAHLLNNNNNNPLFFFFHFQRSRASILFFFHLFFLFVSLCFKKTIQHHQKHNILSLPLSIHRALRQAQLGDAPRRRRERGRCPQVAALDRRLECAERRGVGRDEQYCLAAKL